MICSYWFSLELDIEREDGLPIRGQVEVEYEVWPPEPDVGFHGRVEVVGVSRSGRPIKRLDRYLLRNKGDWLDGLAEDDWNSRDG